MYVCMYVMYFLQFQFCNNSDINIVAIVHGISRRYYSIIDVGTVNETGILAVHVYTFELIVFDYLYR